MKVRNLIVTPFLVCCAAVALSADCLASPSTEAQSDVRLMPDLFSPIGKYLQSGDCDRLSGWFADNLDIEILKLSNNCSRNQARLILKGFFDENPPTSFVILHKSAKESMRYAIGQLTAGGQTYNVVIYIKSSEGKNFIEHISINRLK